MEHNGWWVVGLGSKQNIQQCLKNPTTHRDHSICSVYFNGLRRVLHSQIWIKGKMLGSQLVKSDDAGESHAEDLMLVWWNWGLFLHWPQLQCVLYCERKTHSIHAQQPLLLSQSPLVQGSGLQHHVKEEILFSRALPECYFRNIISTQLAEPAISVTRNKTVRLCCIRTEESWKWSNHRLETRLFLEGFLRFCSITSFHT